MALELGNRTSAEVVTRTHATAVPRNAVRNTGLITVTLMDCIAAIASLAGRRARAFITQTEKAKKNPAISPQPSAEKSEKQKHKRPPAAKNPPAEERQRAGTQRPQSASGGCPPLGSVTGSDTTTPDAGGGGGPRVVAEVARR